MSGIPLARGGWVRGAWGASDGYAIDGVAGARRTSFASLPLNAGCFGVPVGPGLAARLFDVLNVGRQRGYTYSSPARPQSPPGAWPVPHQLPAPVPRIYGHQLGRLPMPRSDDDPPSQRDLGQLRVPRSDHPFDTHCPGSLSEPRPSRPHHSLRGGGESRVASQIPPATTIPATKLSTKISISTPIRRSITTVYLGLHQDAALLALSTPRVRVG